MSNNTALNNLAEVVKNLKAIIFDMNGVIIDDEEIQKLVTIKALNQAGIRFNSTDYMKYCDGIADRESFSKIGRDLKVDFDINQVINNKNRLYMEFFPKIDANSGVQTLIKELSNYYKLGVCSASINKEVNLVLDKFNIFDYFQSIVSSEDVSNGKPNPEPYLLSARKLGISPEFCLVIEDSPNGIQSAKAAGMYCIGISTTHANNELTYADITLDSFEEIRKYLLG